MSVSETVLGFVSHLVHLVLGNNRLRHYERVCLVAWRSTLHEEFQERLDKQLGKFDFVQRQARGTKTIFYSVRDPQYKTWGEFLFPVHDEGLKVFTGNLIGKIGDVVESVRFDVYLHRGRLSSVEFVSELGAMASLSREIEVEDPTVLVDIAEQEKSMGSDSIDIH